MKDKITDWMMGDRTGLSSMVMASTAVGKEVDYPAHPHDPADFNRCLLLLKAVPEVRESFSKIAALTKEWAAIIRHWDEIEKSFLDEVGEDWCNAKNAPGTYELIKNLLGEPTRGFSIA